MKGGRKKMIFKDKWKKNEMEIVKFEDDTYGIRKGNSFNYQFADLRVNEHYWWFDGHYRLGRCNGTLEQAEEAYKRYVDIEKKLKDKGKPYETRT